MLKIANAVARFHSDESGEAAVTNVAILAVGATVLIGLLGLWNGTIMPQTKELIGRVLGGGSAS